MAVTYPPMVSFSGYETVQTKEVLCKVSRKVHPKVTLESLNIFLRKSAASAHAGASPMAPEAITECRHLEN